MNDKQLDAKIRHDATEIGKDLDTILSDGVSQFSRAFEKVRGDARDTLAGAADTVKREVGQGLNQYNAKAQELANKVPGDLAKNATKYPWVAISLGVGIGLLLGFLLKPSRQS